MGSKEFIQRKFEQSRDTPGDINEHIECLYRYAVKCSSIIELGVRGCVSSWALLKGIVEHQGEGTGSGAGEKRMLLVDKDACNVEEVVQHGQATGIKVTTYWGDDLTLKLTEDYDMVFIDTWHVYAQLKRELALFAPRCKKYIIMHDTTIDAEKGEAVRYEQNVDVLSVATGFPSEEIGKGLWFAIEEFVATHPEWVIAERFTHNNGLTILQRVG